MLQRSSRSVTSYPRVLLVDDDLDILEALTTWLQESCHAEVIAFGSAEEAMAVISPESFDVCVLDYCLTGADGLTLGAMLREINPAARLILVSGELSGNVESLAREHGFGRIFTKPVSLETLRDAIVA